MNKEEKEYLTLVHRVHRKHGIQTKIFTKIPYAVCYELFTGHCDFCQIKLNSRPMYVVKFPTLQTNQVRYWCNYCASIHEKYIICLIITKN